MGSFYETVFLKENSSLEDKLDNIKNNHSYKKEDINMLEKGIKGEKEVAYHLSKSNVGMYVIRDLNLAYEDLKAQIDFIVVTSHHCYFIECKNYSADIIHIDETRNFEISKKYKNRYKKQGIKSPLSQVDDQLEVFKKICLNNQEKTKELLHDIKFKDYFKTMVVFTNPENRLNNKKAPNDIKYRVLKVDNLIRQIEYDSTHYEGQRLNQEQMYAIANYILDNNVEVEIKELPKEIEYNNTYSTESKVNNKRYNDKKKYNGLLNDLKGFAIGMIVLFLIYVIGSAMNHNSIDRQKNNNNINETNIKYPDRLNIYQRQSLTKFKEAYNDSQTNGFTIIHTDYCNNLNVYFNNDITCNTDPIEVSYENNTVKFYRPLSHTCYKLTISDDGLYVNEAEYSNISDDSCRGNPIGMIEWDENNSYYQKIGGFNTIKKLSIYAYKKGPYNVGIFDSSHLKERGCNEYNFSGYVQDINYFFSAVTGNNGNFKSNTSKDNFEKMVFALYCIKK